MDFKEFYNQEQIDEGRATPHNYTTKIEEFIVKSANHVPFNAREKQFEAVSDAIVKRFNFPEGAVHTGKHFGELNQEYLDTMKRLGRTTRSDVKPKTDFVIGGERISLKMNKGWLFAHYLYDTQGCLEYTLNNNKTLADEIKNILVRSIEDLRKKQEVISAEKDKFEGYGTHKDDLTNTFVDIMKKHREELILEFMKNGLTGEFKFKKDDMAVADKLMVVKFRKDVSVKEAIKDINLINLDKSFIADIKNDNEYIKILAGKARLSFMYNYKIKKMRFDINEGEIFDKIVSLLKQGYDKAKDQIQKLFNYLMEQLRKGVNYFLTAIGIDVSVQLQNEIEF